MLPTTRHTQPGSEASLTGKAYLVQNIKNQGKPVVCREKADTEVYVGGSKPLNHLQMIERDNDVYWKTNRKINNDLQCN